MIAPRQTAPHQAAQPARNPASVFTAAAFAASLLAGSLLVLAPAAAAPMAMTANADCPAPGTNALADHPTAPKGVTDTVIAAIDLGQELKIDGRQLRTRRLVVQPGGIVPFHSHVGRPALIYTVSGAITEYRSSCTVPIEHKAGDIAREADGISHYWVNRGKVAAVLLSSDVFTGQ